MSANVEVTKITLLERPGRMDTLYLHVSEDMEKAIHGQYYEWHKGSSFRMEVTKGRGEEAIKALGLTHLPIERIQAP